MPPETRYTRSGDVSIAYQVIGDGPLDLVFVPGFVSNVEYAWAEPSLVDFYEQLASFCRLIVFDKRGTGLSDRVAEVATLETRMDDVRAVMDAAGSEQAALLGYSEGASMAILFGTTYPERTPALILYGSYLAWDWMAAGRFPTRHESARAALEEIERRWARPSTATSSSRTTRPRSWATRAFAAGTQRGSGSAPARPRRPPFSA